MEGDKKTFAILPAIKTNIFQPKKTAEKEGLKIAKFIENILNLYKKDTDKEYEERIVLSGNSISNYTVVKIANYLDEKSFIKNIKTDLRINQPAEGGFGPVQVNESDLDINKNIFDNLSSLIVSNGKFDNWNGFTAFHKKDIFFKLTKKIYEMCKKEFDENNVNIEGAVNIFKLDGKTLDKPINLTVEDGKEVTYKNAIEQSSIEEQEIDYEKFPEEFKLYFNFANDTKGKINKVPEKNFIDFGVIDENGKKIIASYSLIENKIDKIKIVENNKEIEIKNKNIDNNHECIVYLKHDNKFDYLNLKK